MPVSHGCVCVSAGIVFALSSSELCMWKCVGIGCA